MTLWEISLVCWQPSSSNPQSNHAGILQTLPATLPSLPIISSTAPPTRSLRSDLCRSLWVFYESSVWLGLDVLFFNIPSSDPTAGSPQEAQMGDGQQIHQATQEISTYLRASGKSTIHQCIHWGAPPSSGWVFSKAQSVYIWAARYKYSPTIEIYWTGAKVINHEKKTDKNALILAA